MKKRIYVYGTLRQGGLTVDIPGKMYNIGWFPGVRLGGDTTFKAEMIEASPSEIANLDTYEGFNPNNHNGSLYIRTPIFEGTPEEGEIYVYNRPLNEDRFIEHGDWLKHTGQAQGTASGLGMEG